MCNLFEEANERQVWNLWFVKEMVVDSSRRVRSCEVEMVGAEERWSENSRR
jgi:hypothetical protein